MGKHLCALIKGSLLHEILSLPIFWAQAVASNLPKARAERLFYGPGRRQYYLLAKPSAAAARGPLLIYLHGGSWRWGKPEYFLAHAALLNQLGYTVALPTYRPTPRANYAAIREDLAAMLRHLPRALELSFESLPSTELGGMSAGGHLAAMIALDHRLRAQAGLPAQAFRRFAALGAPLDLELMPDNFIIRSLAGHKGQPAFQEANPAYWAERDSGQHLSAMLVHGTHDGMVPLACAMSFVKCWPKGAPLQLAREEKGTHLSAASWFFKAGAPRQALMRWWGTATSGSTG